ncbi:MAG: ATP-binding protein [Pseudomonadota bacterium]
MTRRALAAVCTLLLMLVPPRVIAEVSPELLAELDRAFNELNSPPDRRPELVSRVDAALGALGTPDNPVWIRTRIVEAVANMRLNQIALALEQIQSLCPRIDPDGFPALAFRCHSLDAALTFLNGDRERAVRTYEALLAAPSRDVPAGLLNRARVNYGLILNNLGRSDAAADIFESAMTEALAETDDITALHAGNNLTVILIDQGNYASARQTLERLRPIMARHPNVLMTDSLLLHDFELCRIEGKLDLAIDGLTAYINRPNPAPPLLLGSAHKFLADALRESGDLAASLENAEQSVRLLQGRINEATEARLSVAQTLMALGDYDRVLSTLGAINLEQEQVPRRRIDALRLELEAKLRLSGRGGDAELLSAIAEANEAHYDVVSSSRSAYFNARLAAANSSMELQRVEAEAREALARSEAEWEKRKLGILLLFATIIGAMALMWLTSRRRATQELMAQKEAQNEALEQLVSEKTRELEHNLRAQAEMSKALDRNRRAEAIARIAGNVAHDFNNLLQVVASAHEVLADGDARAGDRARALDAAGHSVSHGSTIIRQLLAFSSQQEMAPRAVRVGHYLEANEALLMSSVAERVTLHIEDRTDGAALLVDPALLTTAILNLLSNACHAMPEGGHANIVSRNRDLSADDPHGFGDLQHGEYVEISIADTGIGMTRNQVQRAMEPFFSTRDNQMGTGLGLSSVYGFVRQSGGDLHIQSQSGEGTLVQMLLPRTHETPQDEFSAPTVAEAAEPSIHGRRLMLVEDDDGVAEMVMTVLARLGLDTVRVDSGDAAQVHLSRDARFEFVLTDVSMPGALNGPRLADWITERLPHIDVVLMTGYQDIVSSDSPYRLIRKPFTTEGLREVLTGTHAASRDSNAGVRWPSAGASRPP